MVVLRVAWDVSHQEFTIEDHYYFSILKKLLESEGVLVSEISDLRDLNDYDVLVLNYPERPFNMDDVRIIRSFLERGGRVILLGYYNNEDGIADNVNSLASHFGIRLNKDAIIDNQNNFGDDKFFVVTSKVNIKDISKVMMACTASVTPTEDSAIPIIVGEHTARSTEGHEPIIAVYKKVGEGDLIVFGTCVFWDNYSIEKYDNKKLALKLLTEKELVISKAKL